MGQALQKQYEHSKRYTIFAQLRISKKSNHRTSSHYTCEPLRLQEKSCEYASLCFIHVQYNTVQYNTMQCNTLHYTTLHDTTLHYNTMHNTIQYDTIQCNAMQCNTTQYNTVQYNTIVVTTVQVSKWHAVVSLFGRSLSCPAHRPTTKNTHTQAQLSMDC